MKSDTTSQTACEPPAASPSPAPRPSAFVPCATAFVAGACVMVVELLAFRMVSRFLGSSNYTTSAIIGVVLGGLALGNYIGGRLADRFRTRLILSTLFIIASAACFAIPVLNTIIGEWPALWFLTWPQRIAAHVALTFIVPSMVLGTISPVVAKMALDAGREVGRTVGGVSAWGVIGSILGTFAAGFYLIPMLGLYTLNYAVGGVLAVMGLLFATRRGPGLAWAAASLLLIWFATSERTSAAAADWGLRDAIGPHVLFDKASEYSQVRVERVPGEPTERVMLLDKLAHSFYNPGAPDKLLYGYENVYDAVTDHVAPGREDLDVLILGGGGYTHPRHILHKRPRSRIQVVEIDPVVTEAAMAAFDLAPDTRMSIVHLDARQHVSNLLRRKRSGDSVPEFDLVFLDAISDYNVPSHLTTIEFQSMLRELMSPGGVYVQTLVDVYDIGEFLSAQIATAQRTFKYVRCFFANEAGADQAFDPDDRNTFIIVAADRDLGLDRISGSPEMDQARRLLLDPAVVDRLLARERPSVLTDDWAPIEHLLAGVVQQPNKTIHRMFYNRGSRAEATGDWQRAVESYQEAVRLKPDFLVAHMNLGYVLLRLNRYDEALEAFRSAARIDPRHPGPLLNIGNVYYTRQDYESALGYYRQAVTLKPDYATGYYQMGLALGRLGRLAKSKAVFERALELNPSDAAARKSLGEVERAMATHP